jgi:hypothetical protein
MSYREDMDTLQLYNAGLISRRTAQSRLGLDAEEEARRIAKSCSEWERPCSECGGLPVVTDYETGEIHHIRRERGGSVNDRTLERAVQKAAAYGGGDDLEKEILRIIRTELRRRQNPWR